RSLSQWFFRITDYADRLLDNLQTLRGWPDKVKIMQHNWIGRSYGVEVHFPIEGSDRSLAVFTTRIDTIYGATFMVMAPEHPLVPELIAEAPNRGDIEAFIEAVSRQDEISRSAAETEKLGIFTGRYCRNPVSGERIPIWLGNYVLMGYGTGAIMAVPAHDQRDLEFARRYGLRIPSPPGRDRKSTRLNSSHV